MNGKFHDQLADPKTGKVDLNNTETLNQTLRATSAGGAETARGNGEELLLCAVLDARQG